MNNIHPDIANKPVECVLFHLASEIDWFAGDCQMNPDTLFGDIAHAIRTRHQESLASPIGEHPPGVRYLEAGNVGIYYQVLPETVEIGVLIALLGRLPYDSASRLCTDFTS